MKLYVPATGDQLKLIHPWTFKLYWEGRNYTFLELLNSTHCKNGLDITLDPGTVLKVERVYIRTSSSEYNSLTFRIIESTQGYAKQRFWAKLQDCNNIEFDKLPVTKPTKLQKIEVDLGIELLQELQKISQDLGRILFIFKINKKYIISGFSYLMHNLVDTRLIEKCNSMNLLIGPPVISHGEFCDVRSNHHGFTVQKNYTPIHYKFTNAHTVLNLCSDHVSWARPIYTIHP